MRKFAASVDSSFHKQFLCSMLCCLMPITHSRIVSELESSLLDSATALHYINCLCNILNPLLSFQHFSLRIDSISRNHFLCPSLRSNSLSVQVLSLDGSSLVIYSGWLAAPSTSALGCFTLHFYVLETASFLEPQELTSASLKLSFCNFFTSQHSSNGKN